MSANGPAANPRPAPVTPSTSRESSSTMTLPSSSTSPSRSSARLPRYALLKLAIDVALFVVATPIAYLLRFDGAIPAGTPVALSLLVLVPVKTAAHVALGLPRRSWSNLSFRDLGSLLALASIVAVPGTILLLAAGPELGIP